MLSGGKVNAIGVATAEPLSYFFEDPFARLMMIGITEACDESRHRPLPRLLRCC